MILMGQLVNHATLSRSYLFPLPDLVEGLVDLLLPVVLQVVEVVMVVHLRDELGARDVVQRLQDARERRTLVSVLLPARCKRPRCSLN